MNFLKFTLHWWKNNAEGNAEISWEISWEKHNKPAKCWKYPSTFEAIWTTVLRGLVFQMLQKMLRAGKTSRHRIIVYENLILTKKMTFRDSFFPAVVSHTNYIKGKVFFLLFSLFHFHWLLLTIKIWQKAKKYKTYSFSNWWWLVWLKSFSQSEKLFLFTSYEWWKIYQLLAHSLSK